LTGEFSNVGSISNVYPTTVAQSFSEKLNEYKSANPAINGLPVTVFDDNITVVDTNGDEITTTTTGKTTTTTPRPVSSGKTNTFKEPWFIGIMAGLGGLVVLAVIALGVRKYNNQISGEKRVRGFM